MLYTLYCQAVNNPVIEVYEVINKYFDAATVIRGKGLWKSKTEESFTIHLVNNEDDDRVNALALALKKAYKQSAVLVQKVCNQNWLV